MAVLLLTVFVILLVAQARSTSEEEDLRARELAEAQARTAEQVFQEPIPQGMPTEPQPYEWKPAPRYSGQFSRWNLKELPEGWDPKLAEQIHSYFEAMEIDPKNPQKTENLERLREELRDFLATLGPEALPTLGAILNAEGDFVDRRFLIVAIGELGPKSDDATFILHDFFLARSTNPQNRSELVHVVKAMGSLQNDTSFQILSSWIERRDDPAMQAFRDAFVESLGEHPRREDAVGLFVDQLQTQDYISTQTRNKSAQALGKVASVETLPDLYEAVQKEKHWVVQQTLLGSIAKIGRPESVPFLRDIALSNKKSAVRLSAANALRRIGTPQALHALNEAARAESDPEVKKRVEAWAAGREK